MLAAAAGGAYTWWERSQGGAPWDPSRSPLPEGVASVVHTDDGAVLDVSVIGPADAPTVVLPHCWVGSRQVWGPVARRLADRGLRVVLYDQRGHGVSTMGDRPASIAVLGDDLRAVLEAVDARDVVLGGHSMGGMTIQSYAAEHPGDFKERVRAIVLVSTAATVARRSLPPEALERIMGEASSDVLRRGPLGYMLVRQTLGKNARRADVELTLDGLARTSGAARVGFLGAFTSMDLRSTLAGMEVPATVLVGSRDRLTPPAAARVLASELPAAELVVLPGVGHMLPLEAPDVVADALVAAHATVG